MWRFLEGVKEPPSKKPRLSSEERKAQVKEYEEERRKRSYNEKWMLDDSNKRREWLEYDSDKNQMHCKDCRMYANGESQKRGSFVIGTQHFKLESIKEHEKSQGHKKCSSTAASKKAAPSTSLAEKALCSLKHAQNEKMEKLFRTAHAIAKGAGHSQTLSGCVI